MTSAFWIVWTVETLKLAEKAAVIRKESRRNLTKAPPKPFKRHPAPRRPPRQTTKGIGDLFNKKNDRAWSAEHCPNLFAAGNDFWMR